MRRKVKKTRWTMRKAEVSQLVGGKLGWEEGVVLTSRRCSLLGHLPKFAPLFGVLAFAFAFDTPHLALQLVGLRFYPFPRELGVVCDAVLATPRSRRSRHGPPTKTTTQISSQSQT